MGVRINITNQRLTLGGLDRKLIAVLNTVSSYKVEGYYWSSAYKAGHWDGKEHLLKVDRRTREHVAPVGLLDDYLLALKARKIKPEIDDQRPEPERIEVGWDGTELRDYQLRAVKRVLAEGPLRGVGIVNMPIRSGKTKTAAAVIAMLKVRTLFVVPSKQLLQQTRTALAETLQMEVGQLGDGEYTLRDVTVATIQTLSMLNRTTLRKASTEAGERWDKLKGEKPHRREYVANALVNARSMMDLWKQVQTMFGLVFMDECHHLTADDWRQAMMSINARYRIGLSATAFPELSKEQSRGVIWLKACCGPVRIRVDMDKLIAAGWLTPARVIVQEVLSPDLNHQGWSQKLRDECVLLNPHRNGLIIAYAQRYAAEGCRVLITSNRHSQVAALLSTAATLAVPCAYLIGSASKKWGLGAGTTKERSRKVAGLIAREPPILIGTVLSEGVDIPEVDVVINAEGGKDVKATIQRMRNLTVSEGKTEAIFVDFMDLTNAYFRRHSKARLKVYKSYGGFTVEQVRDVAA